MQYLKRNTKYSILAFFIIVLSITVSFSILAKKVKGEFRLMCIGWNLKKMHKLMAYG